MSEQPVTSQPKSSVNVNIEDINNKIKNVQVPKIDVQDLIQGDWKVGHFECLNDPPICKLVCTSKKRIFFLTKHFLYNRPFGILLPMYIVLAHCRKVG